MPAHNCVKQTRIGQTQRMVDPARGNAERHRRLAQILELIEVGMHSTAEALVGHARSRMHQRANAVTEQAVGHERQARRILGRD